MPNDTDLTPGVLAELKRLEQASEDVEKQFGRFSVRHCESLEPFEDALRNAAPALTAAAEECERLRGLLWKHQWSNRMYDCTQDEMIGYCPECHGCEPNHAPDCRLAAAIGKK